MMKFVFRTITTLTHSNVLNYIYLRVVLYYIYFVKINKTKWFQQFLQV